MNTPKKTDTLVFAEARWKTVVIAVFIQCTACSIALVVQKTQATLPEALCIIACAALVISNTVHLIVDGTTFGMIPLSIVSFGLAGASVGIRPLATIGLAVGIVLLAGFALLRSAYTRIPKVSDRAMLVVLGCAVEDGRPSKTLERRLERALSILSAQPSTCAVVTGGPVAGSTLTEADVMAQWLIEHGIEPARVFLERQARNTNENLANSVALLEQLGLAYDQIAIVSSDYHLWRARDAARRLKLPLDIMTVAAPTPPASRLQQWSREVLVVIKDFFVQD